PSWNTFFVPGEPVAWMQDAAEPGAVTELEVAATAGGTAHVWTPPGYDTERTEPYPTLLLLAGAEQSAREWIELGRAPQILDNLAAEGAIEPMVVVMAQVEDARAVTEHLVPAVRRDFHVADGAGALAVAG